MPAASVFVDSNVLLYQRDLAAQLGKQQRVGEWLDYLVRRGLARANLQVINEITSVMLRKRGDIEDEAIFASVAELHFLGTSPIDTSTVERARGIRRATRYSWWDCLLLASALELGCSWFLTEDLQDGLLIEGRIQGLTIVDPFAHSPHEIFPTR